VEIERVRPKVKKSKWAKYTGRQHLYKHSDDSYYMTHDGFDIRLMVLIFDAVCAITKTTTFENAILTCQILRGYNNYKEM